MIYVIFRQIMGNLSFISPASRCREKQARVCLLPLERRLSLGASWPITQRKRPRAHSVY